MESAEADVVPEYITVLNEHDVLLGRGAPILNSAGNVRFRNLIKENRPAYTATGRHAVKDEIAKTILHSITEKGGRFLRKIESDEDRTRYKVPRSVLHAWVTIDRTAQLQKVKQALREQLTSRAASGKKKDSKRQSMHRYDEESRLNVSGDDQATTAEQGLPPFGYSINRTSLDGAAREYQRTIPREPSISEETLLMHGRLALDRQLSALRHPLDRQLVFMPQQSSSLPELQAYGSLASSSSFLDPYRHLSDRNASQMLDQYVLDLQLRGEMLARELAIARAAQQRAATLGGERTLPRVAAIGETKLPSSSSSSDESELQDGKRGPDHFDDSKPRAR